MSNIEVINGEKKLKIGEGLYLNLDLHQKLLKSGGFKPSTLESARNALKKVIESKKV